MLTVQSPCSVVRGPSPDVDLRIKKKIAPVSLRDFPAEFQIKATTRTASKAMFCTVKNPKKKTLSTVLSLQKPFTPDGSYVLLHFQSPIKVL